MNSFLEDTQPSLIRKMNRMAGPDTINLGLGQVDKSPSSNVREVGVEAIQQEENYRYTPTSGFEDLRRTAAEDYNQRHGTSYDEDNILVTAGATPALSSAFVASLEKSQKVLAPEIGYPTYWLVPEMLSVEVERYSLSKDFTPEISDLEEKMEEGDILVLNSPSNPCGSVISESKLRKICGTVKDKGGKIISDEVYEEIYFGKRVHSPNEYAPESTITVTSLSKSGLMPGMRIGWVITQQEYMEEITKAHQFLNSCVNSVAQKMAGEVVNQDKSGVRDWLRKNRDLLTSELSEAGFAHNPQGALYSFVDIEDYGSSLEVAKRLLKEENVLTIPGKAFGRAGDSYLRISFGVQRDALREGAKRIRRFFEDAG